MDISTYRNRLGASRFPERLTRLSRPVDKLRGMSPFCAAEYAVLFEDCRLDQSVKPFIINTYQSSYQFGMAVHKEVTITATSTESWEDAALNAVERTDTSVENLQWAVVQDQSIELVSSDSPQFKSKVKIGFEVKE